MEVKTKKSQILNNFSIIHVNMDLKRRNFFLFIESCNGKYTHNEHWPSHRHIHLYNGIGEYQKILMCIRPWHSINNLKNKIAYSVIIRPPFQVFIMIRIVYRVIKFFIDLRQTVDKKNLEFNEHISHIAIAVSNYTLLAYHSTFHWT